MIKGYYMPIPPLFSDVLAEIGEVPKSSDFETIITAARAKFFNFTYQIPTDHKQEFEEFVLNYFITRRIGSGNVRKWRQWFKAKLLQIMPFYYKLIESTDIEFDPLNNVDYIKTESGSGTSDTTRDSTLSGTSANTRVIDNDTTSSETTASTLVHDGEDTKTHSGQESESHSDTEINRYSDTPQGDSSKVWEVVQTPTGPVPAITDVYLTDIRAITNNGSSSGNNSYTESGTQDYTDTLNQTKSGTGTSDTTQTDNGTTSETGQVVTDNDYTHQNSVEKVGRDAASPSKLLSEYRETIISYYEMISDELSVLFYNLVEVDDLIDFV